MRKIAVFAFNDGCSELENKLPEILSKELKENDYEILDFSSKDLNEMVLQAKEDAYKVVLAIDAVMGQNPTFSRIGRMFFENNIRPIVLITNFDLPNADVDSAERALGDVWALEDDSLPLSHYKFLTAYFSYDTGETYENSHKSNPGKGLAECIFYSN